MSPSKVYSVQVADVHDQQERWPSIFPRHGPRIAVRLIAGLEHGVVPLTGASDTVPCANGLGTIFDQHGELIRVRLFAPLGALLGLQYEAAFAIEVYEAPRLDGGVNEGDRALETVVVVLVVAGGDLRFFYA